LNPELQLQIFHHIRSYMLWGHTLTEKKIGKAKTSPCREDLNASFWLASKGPGTTTQEPS
jgi:hypothetical protein